MIEIEDFEVRKMRRGFFGGPMEEIATATIRMTYGTLGVSKWHDETFWAVDSFLGLNGMPRWVNGEGSRVTRIREIKQTSDEFKALEKLRAEKEKTA